jgi:phosphocarrier protein HPr
MAGFRVTIINRLGLHARAAAKFVQTASRFGSTVTVTKGAKEVNGKSIMGVMMLAAAQNAEIEIDVEGDDSEQALAALLELINDRFGESS